MKICTCCPRGCRVDRGRGELGFCGVGASYRICRADLHPWEEPCISGSRGSGTIFFSGCNLRCVFCQNKEISRAPVGAEYSGDALIEKMLELEARGAHNINLVTPTPYLELLPDDLRRAREQLNIPIVFNCGGYESTAALRRLRGLVDVYLTDFKYYSNELAEQYSSASGYREAASAALDEMLFQASDARYLPDGTLARGVIVRHLVLPGRREDSLKLLDYLASRFPVEKILLSLMRQYTPDFAASDAPKNLKRRLTRFEYESVLSRAAELGFSGFSQEGGSAAASYTPSFDTKE